MEIDADRQRQSLLESMGLRVLRLTAQQVETELPAAIQTIRSALTSPPSPPVGEGGWGDEGAQLPLWKKEWKGAEGLAEDVRYYGKWMRDEAEKRIGHLYPKYKITRELLDERPDLKAQGLKAGDELTVIAWLWARTVKCPNPACRGTIPLIQYQMEQLTAAELLVSIVEHQYPSIMLVKRVNLDVSVHK